VTDNAPDEGALLQRAAARVSHDDGFVAAAFRAWCGDELAFEAVAGELGCSVSAAVHASLCRKPRLDSFGADVEAIAESSGVDAQRLGALLRQAASIAAFRSGGGRQVLAAARDTPDGAKEPKG
jgi:hypothetical protein